ncbi:MAG: hypothetical protein U5L96_06605 [Owenweeksia sp.]|nr:hypothetical protein [Owenweeksia sp.]
MNPIALRDQAYSPLVYSGVGFDAFLGYKATGERKETIWLLSVGRANLSNSYSRNLSTNAIRLTNLNFYARANEDANLRWGWSNNNGFHHRLIDDFQNFNGRVDYFTTFGPAAIYELPLALKGQSFKFRTTAHIQLIGIYLPSGYVASLPSGFGYEPNSFAGAVVQSMRVFYPGSSFNAGLWPQLEWHLNSGNGIAVNYLYEYSHFGNPHRSIRSSGHWFISFNMTL